MASIHEKLTRVRKPRVHIKYEVETEDGVIQKELPFVVGVLGDFSGQPSEPLKPLKDRKFTKIDRDNFNEVMTRMRPGLNFRVENTLTDANTELQVNLQFNAMEDFEPSQIVQQVPALKALLDARNKLRDLLSKSERSDELEKILEKALQDPVALQSLAKDLDLN